MSTPAGWMDQLPLPSSPEIATALGEQSLSVAFWAELLDVDGSYSADKDAGDVNG